MYARRLCALTLVVCLTLLAACSTPIAATPSAAGHASTRAAAAPALDHLPLYFVANDGQTDPRVAFYVPGKDNTIYFSPDGLTFALTSPAAASDVVPGPRPRGAVASPATPAQRWAVKLDFVGANPAVQPLGENQSAAVFSYFRGEKSDWKAGVSSFAQVRYPNLWPGIDLVYSGQGNQLKYQFEVQPGADPAQIQLAYRGASTVQLTADGRLVVSTPVGGFQDAAPVAYQMKAGQRVPVAMTYQLDPGEGSSTQYSFNLGAYDPTLPLVLDPAVIVYAGYIGGTGLDFGFAVAVDNQGYAYVTGETNSDQNSFPVKVGPDTTLNGTYYDAFVAKVNAAGTALVYAGYIGGKWDDQGDAIAVDGAGNAFIAGTAGSSQSDGFPAIVGPNLSNNGNFDAFVAEVNAAGTGLVYAGFIGGISWDVGTGIAVDSHDNAYVSGSTTSNETDFTNNHFPVKVGPDLTYNGGSSIYGDAFVAKVNPSGSALIYAGYIGGSGDERSYGIAIDHAGNAYVTGYTSSSAATFPVKTGPDLIYNGGVDYGDAFVAKVNSAGTGLDYAGYIGGAGDDVARGIAVDGAGNAYITGETNSNQATFPVKNGPDLTFNGPVTSTDAFVAEVNASGAALGYAGYIGGAGADDGNAIAVDSVGNAYITGFTGSSQATFPAINGPDATYNGGGDAFVAKLNPGGTAFDYIGYLGGSGADVGYGIAIDGQGNAYVTGITTSTQASFPVKDGPDLTYNGGTIDAFIAKISLNVGVLPVHLFLPLVLR